MFRYSLFLDTLLKAMTHKYVRRIPKGVTKTGKTKYMYFYAGQEGHGKGIAHENELVTGASFAFGEHRKTRYHAHITKVDGDKVTVRYDDGEKKGKEETMTKKQFQSLLHGEHKESIKQAQSKAEKQLQEAKTHKERGVKFSDKTMSKLESQVNKLKGIVSPDQPPAEIEASWISEKEKKTFEGQNKVLDMLKDPTLFKQVVRSPQNFSLCTVMLNNIMHAVFKYKDLSSLSSDQKKTMLSIHNDILNSTSLKRGLIDLHRSLVIIGDIWQKLPFKQKMESEQVGRVQITDTEISKTSNSTNIDKISNILKNAKKQLQAINPKLDKILYGDVFLCDLRTRGRGQAGFYTSFLDQIDKEYIHDPDHIYINMGENNLMDYYKRKFNEDNPDIQKKIGKDIEETLIHEFAHRLTENIFSKSSAMKVKVAKLLREADNNYVHISKLDNVPMGAYLLTKDILGHVLPQIANAKEKTGSGTYDLLTSDNKKVKPNDIDYANIEKTTYRTSGEHAKRHVIAVPLKNGGVATFKVSKDMMHSVAPSTYALTNVEEFFSETMAAIANPQYGTEPNTFAYKLRNEFTQIINDHIDEF